MENVEFSHAGIKGMRWGIRRFQNKDGSLTPAGRKRYSKGDGSKSSKSAASNKKTTTDKTEGAKKSVKDMTDDELVKAIRRSELEKRYRDLNPEQVSAGKKIFRNVIEPAVTQAGKTLLTEFATKKGKELLGIKDTDSVGALRKEVEKMNLERQYKDLKDTYTSDLRREVQKRNLEKQLEKLKSDAAKEYDDATTKSTETKTDKNSSDDSADSSASTAKARKWTQESPIIDADYSEVSSSPKTQAAKTQIGELLKLPLPKEDE